MNVGPSVAVAVDTDSAGMGGGGVAGTAGAPGGGAKAMIMTAMIAAKTIGQKAARGAATRINRFVMKPPRPRLSISMWAKKPAMTKKVTIRNV